MKHLLSPPTPLLGPQHLKIFTCCSLEYSVTNRQGTLGAGLVRIEEENSKKRETTTAHQPVIQSKREQSNPRSIPNRADPPGFCAPHVELTKSHSSQLQTAESFRQVMCTYLLVRNNSHSLLQPSFPCFPLVSDLLPTVKH